MNKSIFIGRLTRDPDIRTAQNGTMVARFSLAVDRRYKKEGGPEADFFSMVAFGKSAEFAEKYLRQGSKVAVEAEAQNNNYTNNNGEKVYGIDFIVNYIEFAESKADADQRAQGQMPQQMQGQYQQPAYQQPMQQMPQQGYQQPPQPQYQQQQFQAAYNDGFRPAQQGVDNFPY